MPSVFREKDIIHAAASRDWGFEMAVGQNNMEVLTINKLLLDFETKQCTGQK